MLKQKTIQLTICEVDREAQSKYGNTIINSPDLAYQFVRDFLSDLTQEVIVILNLDTKLHLIDVNVCSIGTADMAVLSPKDALKNCLLSGASSFMMVHNHPSGSATPSKEDRDLTKRLASAANLIGLQLIDSLIVGHGRFFSFFESDQTALVPLEFAPPKEEAMQKVAEGYTPKEHIPNAPSVSEDKPVYVSDLRRSAVESLVKIIEEGKAQYLSAWRGDAMRPQNPISGARYKGGNRLLLMTSAIQNNYQDPRWLTFKQAQDAGLYIKKGEKATRCEKWIYTEKKSILDENGNKILDENGKELKEEVLLSRPKCNIFYVFNGEQIDRTKGNIENFPVYEPEHIPETEIEKRVDALQASSECPILNVAQDQAYYSPSEDKIVLPLKSAFSETSAYAEVLAHEMVHSTSIEERLNRTTGIKQTKEYNFEELVAELGSVFVLNDLQIPSSTHGQESAAAYLEYYIDLLKENPNILFQAAAHSERASEFIASRAQREYRKAYGKELFAEKAKTESLDGKEKSQEPNAPNTKRM